MRLFTIGYGAWPPAKRMETMVARLREAGVPLLIDTRHSPCASQLDPEHTYGPRDWHLQTGVQGIAARLADHGIDYLWLVELGNPQKTDPKMTVLREQLKNGDNRWPVNRGLALLKDIIGQPAACALLCACADYRRCHRTLIAQSLSDRFPELSIDIQHL